MAQMTLHVMTLREFPHLVGASDVISSTSQYVTGQYANYHLIEVVGLDKLVLEALGHTAGGGVELYDRDEVVLPEGVQQGLDRHLHQL